MRCQLTIKGAVQGVGFRPFVYRLACDEDLTGVVSNTPQGVLIDIEGDDGAIAQFCRRITEETPPLAVIESIERTSLRPNGAASFAIAPSISDGDISASLLPDAALCSDCRAEITDPNDRRYRHPFANCTNCGPRYSILEALPYDRPNTTMTAFAMCGVCAAEYHDPADRRFHAQPIACPNCGPQLFLADANGALLAAKDDALAGAAQHIRDGHIVAVKGLGGFHLICSALNDRAVKRLRECKQRPRKPFAVMFDTLEQLVRYCIPSAEEAALLSGSQAPIVLTRKRKNTSLSQHVAPGNPYLGAMLAYTPLHHLLLQGLASPVIATSGNRRSEPIVTDNDDALERLHGVADYFLMHDRPITRPVEDSVVRIAAGAPLFLRRARGYAPSRFNLHNDAPSMMALGGHLKNTIAKSVGDSIYLSPHIGDLDTVEARHGFNAAVSDFSKLHRKAPDILVSDKHADYYASLYAAQQNTWQIRVQHHRAHVYAVMAEHQICEPVLGVSWDGAGAGDDGTLWGGEFFLVDANSAPRSAHFLPFRLPGGEEAMRDPRRSVFGMAATLEHPLTYRSMLARTALDEKTEQLLSKMIRQEINAPVTSSVGRLFDGVSAILGLCVQNTFEGEAAMALEFRADGTQTDAVYACSLTEQDAPGAALVIDWRDMLKHIIADLDRGIGASTIARKFHNSLAECVILCAKQFDQQTVVLSGGCFQNKILLERTIGRLREESFRPIWPQCLPPNDGGLALGQLYGAARALSSGDDASCA